MKSSYIFSNVGFIALLTALSQGSLLPQSFRSLSTRNEFGFDPDVLHGGSAGVDPLAGGYDKFAKDHGNDDSGEGPVDGLGDGDSGGNDKGSGNNGGVTVSNGVVKLDLGNGVEANYDEATDTSELDVSKTCGLAKRRRDQLFSRDGPCFTAVQFPEVESYNSLYKTAKTQSDSFLQARIDWTNYEAVRRIKALDHASVVKVEKLTEAEKEPGTGYIITDFKETDLEEASPGVSDATSPQPKEPLTAQSPNTAILGKLTPQLAEDLYVKQIEAARGFLGNEIDNVMVAQAKWSKYLNIDVDAFIESRTKVAVDPTSPMLEQPPAGPVGDLQNPRFRMKGSAQQEFEAELPKIKHLDLDLTTDGDYPEFAQNLIKEHNELVKQTEELTKAGDRAARQLEKAGNLPKGTLAKWFDVTKQHRYNADLKNMKVPMYIKNGYVIKAEGNKIIVQSQPMTTGPKVLLGLGVAVVGGTVGYEIIWGNGN